MRIAKITGSTVNYYHADMERSARLVTSSTGSVLFADNYLPFGQDNGTPTGSETYKFTGKPVSQTTGLYYYYHRWYDPSIGRFISPDPRQGKLSNPQSLNLYIYVLDRPTSLVDPSGLDGCGFWDVGCHVSSFSNTVTGGASTLWSGAVSAGNTAVTTVANAWNDPNTRTIIISAVIIIAVVVATGGLAAPIVVGMVMGGGISGALYGGTCGSSCSVMGALAAISTGAAMGAIGGAAGPLGGTIAGRLGATSTSLFARAASAGIVSGGQGLLDIGGGRSMTQIRNDMAVSFATAGMSSLAGPEGMSTLAQARYFSPGYGAFGRALMGSSENTFNASSILLGDLSTGLLEGLARMIDNS
jgi:RHS repeat-associated protein